MATQRMEVERAFEEKRRVEREAYERQRLQEKEEEAAERARLQSVMLGQMERLLEEARAERQE